jgi:diguanylate cyclase (GGDEF)-like protein/PAS domain S-box-containing protein
MDASLWRMARRTLFSLRGKLVLSFVGLTISVATVTILFAWYGGRQSAETLAIQTATQLTARVAAHVVEYTREAELIAGSALAGVEAGAMDLGSVASLERYLWHASKVSDLASYTYVGTESGLFVGVDRSLRSGTLPGVAFTRIREITGTQLRTFDASAVGDRSHAVQDQAVDYDPRRRPWYALAKQHGSPVFTEPYLSASKKIPVVTYAVPIFDHTGALTGVMGIDFTLSRLAEHLKKLPPSEHGVAVLRSAAGLTLASTHEGKHNEVSDDMAQRAFALAATPERRTSPVWIEDGVVLGVQRVQGAINGSIAVAIPAQDIWSDARTAWQRALALSAVLALAAIALGVSWLKSVIQDLSALRRAAKDFEAGADLSALPVRRQDEIGAVARAFAVMGQRVTSELRSSRTRIESTRKSHDAALESAETHKRELVRSQEQRRRLGTVVDVAHDCIAIVGADFIVGYVNPAFAAELRMPASALIGSRVGELLVDRRSDALTRIRAAAKAGMVVRETMMLKRSDATQLHMEVTLSPIRDDAGMVYEFAVVGRNVTETVLRTDALSREANFDPITELYRRDALVAALQRRILTLPDETLSVLFIDLDGFKAVNDQYGHPAGDGVLREIGRLIRDHIRDGDLAARFGGDEFVLVLADDERERTARAVAERLIKAIAEMTQASLKDIALSASIGITSFPRDSRTVSTLIRYADQAMYTAKRGGGARWESWRRVRPVSRSEDSEIVVSIDRAARR